MQIQAKNFVQRLLVRRVGSGDGESSSKLMITGVSEVGNGGASADGRGSGGTGGVNGATEGTEGLRYVVVAVSLEGKPLEGAEVELWPVGETLVPRGSCVTLLGLKGAAEFNGRRGVVTGIDEEAGRYTVRLEEAKRVKVSFSNALV